MGPHFLQPIYDRSFLPARAIAKRLKDNEKLRVVFTHRKKELEEVYRDASNWPETNELKLMVVLDETRLLSAKNLVYCLNELGKRGVGFILVTQYSSARALHR